LKFRKLSFSPTFRSGLTERDRRNHFNGFSPSAFG
jgi:hypothetical protein